MAKEDETKALTDNTANGGRRPTARYTTTRSDILRFYIHHYGRSRGFLAFQIVLLALLSHSFFRALPPEEPVVVQIIVFATFFLLAVAFLLLLFFGSIAVHVFSKKNKTVTTEHTITLKEEGFLEETPFNTTEHTWAAVQRLRRSRNYIFLYIAAQLAHVIPRRAFSTEEEWNAFYAFCRAKTSKA